MEINFLAIAAGAVAFWILGAIWYSPVLFSKAWQKEVGMSDDDLKGGNMVMIFGGSLVLMFLMCFMLYFVLIGHQAEDLTFTHGAFHGMLLGTLVAASATGINYLYQRKSLKLFAIDAIYQILGLALAGGIMTLLF